ncbi:hypothetical protein JZ751_027127 [Albula glossodonta]|uniref:Uncharacterized protein n=1 Tax=Albula glossodonta TaxID=121402 RepID=A0A8T2NGJ5_9TELE|nr:hypothetical protein JZ751_027127 [Albula glossodonta]
MLRRVRFDPDSPEETRLSVCLLRVTKRRAVRSERPPDSPLDYGQGSPGNSFLGGNKSLLKSVEEELHQSSSTSTMRPKVPPPLPPKPKAISVPSESPSGDDDGNQGTIKRFPPTTDSPSPARPASYVPPRPPPPRLPPHKRSSLGNEPSRSPSPGPVPWDPEEAEAGSFREFWELLHAPRNDDDDEEEEEEEEEEEDESKAVLSICGSARPP